jgi:hypothetical protein
MHNMTIESKEKKLVVDGQQFGHHGPLAELDQVSGSV